MGRIAMNARIGMKSLMAAFGGAAVFFGLAIVSSSAWAGDCGCYGGNASKSGNICLIPNPTPQDPSNTSEKPLCQSASDGFRNPGDVFIYHYWSDPVMADSVVGRLATAEAGGDDPFFTYSSTLDRGSSFNSSTGSSSGVTPGRRIDEYQGGGDGHVNYSKVFNLDANSRLTLGGFFLYDRLNETAFGLGSATRNVYTAGTTAVLTMRDTYVGGGVAGALGDGTLSGSESGSFSSRGLYAAAYVGHVFALSGVPATAAKPYPLGIDARGYLAYAEDVVGGFGDSSGFTSGANRLSYGAVGGEAKLFATIPSGRVTLSPFVSGTFEQQFAFSSTLDIPAQTAFTAQTIYFSQAQTFGGVKAGLDAIDISGINFGANAFYRESSQYRVAGVECYLKFPLARLFQSSAVVAKY